MLTTVAHAMSDQLDRVNRPTEGHSLAEQLRLLMLENSAMESELKEARARIARLEAEADLLAARALTRRAFQRRAAGEGMLAIEGRAVVNQTEAARLLNVKQYQISRWVAAGHFQTVTIGARTLLFADTLHKPAPRARKRKP